GARILILDRAADRAGERLEQAKRRLRAEPHDRLADLPVVDGVADLVAPARRLERQLERQVHAEAPRPSPLGRAVAVVALELEPTHEHAVHGLPRGFFVVVALAPGELLLDHL